MQREGAQIITDSEVEREAEGKRGIIEIIKGRAKWAVLVSSRGVIADILFRVYKCYYTNIIGGLYAIYTFIN